MAKDEAVDLWGNILSQLPECLADWEHQKPSSPKSTVRDWLQIYALFQHWYRTNDFPKDSKEYGLRLAPLICTNPKEQQTFHEFWQAFWKDIQPVPSREEIRQAEVNREQQRAMRPVQRQSAWFDSSTKHLRKVRVWGIAALVVTVMCAGLWIASSLLVGIKPPIASVASPPSTTVVGTTTPVPYVIQAIPTLPSVPLRYPPPSISLSEQEAADLASEFWFKWLLIPVGLLFLIVAAILWYRRKIIFDQIKSWQKNLGTEAIRVSHQHARHALSATQRTRLAAMRFQQVGKRIHWGKTVERTARSAGFPHLQFRPRQRQAEYVMVCDSRHYRDQAAWLLWRVYEEWRATGIHIHYYDFDRHPELVWPNGRRERQAIPLARLRHRHPAGRVLLVAEQEVMFYRVIGGLQSWVEQLKEWPDHSLLFINDLSPSNQQQLEQNGIRWQQLSRTTDTTAVLESLGGTMATREKASDHFPASLQTDAHLWDPDPQQCQDVLNNVTRVVTDDGLRLLGGMAMYPKLHGNLTFALHRELQTTDDTLVNVVRLPWCRAGCLPKWLRDALLDRLSKKDYRTLHDFYRQLFCVDPNVHPEGQFDLGINRPPARDWKQWVKYAIRFARRGEVLSDAIFARMLVSPRWRSRLAFLERLQKVFPRELVERVPASLKVGAVVPMGMVLTWLVWMGLVQVPVVSNWLADSRLEETRQNHGQHIVTLRYHPKAKSLVEPIAKGLKAVGFQVALVENNEVKENWITTPLSVGAEIARIAKYNSWGREYSVFKAEQSVINLATPLETGQVFTEQPPAKVRRSGVYPESVTWVGVPQGLEAKPAMKPPVVGTSVGPIRPTMLKIPGGTFTMGSPQTEPGRYKDEGPQHEVQIAAFEIGETEVTFAEWDRCVEAGVCPQVDDAGWGRGARPVMNVSWNQAQDYIQWLNKMQGLSGGTQYRLPSEAEWEYAARAGTDTAYFWGKEWACGYANGRDNSTKCDYGYQDKTAPVKQYKPNAFGLYDTSGNVWEWVQDCWVDNYDGAPDDGSAREAIKGKSCEVRSLRGGGWNDYPQYLRSANRDWILPVEADFNTGFRLARTP